MDTTLPTTLHDDVRPDEPMAGGVGASTPMPPLTFQSYDASHGITAAACAAPPTPVGAAAAAAPPAAFAGAAAPHEPLPPRVQRLSGSFYAMAEQQAVVRAWVSVDVKGTRRLVPFSADNVRFASGRRPGQGGRFYLDRRYLVQAPDLGLDNTEVPLSLHAPPLKNKWPFRPFVHEAKGNKKAGESWSLELDISNYATEHTAAAATFVSDLRGLTEATVNHLYTNRTKYWARSEDWSRDRVREQYAGVTDMVSYQDKTTMEFKEREPSLRLKVARRGNTFGAYAFDERRNMCELNDQTLSQDRMVVPLIEDQGLMFSPDGMVKDCFALQQITLLDDGIVRTNALAQPTIYMG